jgi:hypothetical protein
VVKVLDARERTVVYQIVGSLEIEGFLYLGVWSYEGMKDYGSREKKTEEKVWRLRLVLNKEE